jgi:hypothetical protein
MLEWDRYGLHKKDVGTRYTEQVFLQLVGAAGHIVHSARSDHATSKHYFLCLVGLV